MSACWRINVPGHCYVCACLRRDWGFLIFGNDLKDAIETFDMQLKEALVGDKVLEGDSAEQAGAPKTPMGVLAHAFRRLRVSRLVAKQARKAGLQACMRSSLTATNIDSFERD